MRVIGTVLYGAPGLIIAYACFLVLWEDHEKLSAHAKESWPFYLFMTAGLALLSRAIWIFFSRK